MMQPVIVGLERVRGTQWKSCNAMSTNTSDLFLSYIFYCMTSQYSACKAYKW